MRALEKYLGLSGLNYNAEKKVEVFKKRVAKAKPCVDTSMPRTYAERANMSPGKRTTSKIERNRLIALDNMLLARRIFSIMEAPGAIHDVIADTRHLDAHAGTMNFPARLEEAQRIHRDNQMIATRLDNIKGVLKKEDVSNATHFNPLQAKVESKRRKMKKLALLQKKRNQGRQVPEWDDTPINTHRSENGESGRGAYGGANQNKSKGGSLSARRSESPSSSSGGGKVPTHPGMQPRPIKILLEYTKIQDGKVLDIAVVKEPFRDQYAVFGIDMDGGQRYELRLSSEDVASILDGDILVTSLDSLEVWVALLNKITLDPVAEFSKLPTTENAEEIIRSSRAPEMAMKPAPPSSGSRPQSKGSASRPGSRIKGEASANQSASVASFSTPLSPQPPSMPRAPTEPRRPVVVSGDAAEVDEVDN